ncbi:MAG: Zn-dependent alcohol dehydrogenase [Arthrobacter sp.]|jgi:S-(hydroxymethyl)glutathione dehydrogenase/alcohol dehydrogenase|nr:Zn-dependent alcohol dehydrogenase [Arthrobacter sp.]
MKAAVVHEAGAPFTVEEVQIAAPQGGEVLIDVQASGLCHSDLSARNFGIGGAFPAIFGHEVAGIVSAVGPDVTEFRVGDHVVGSLIQACGQCLHCLSGDLVNCEHPERTERPADAEPRLSLNGSKLTQGMALGGFAQQALIDDRQLAKVPADMPWAQAALIGCGVLTGAGAVLNTAAVKQGETVVIIGAGGVGLNAISGAVVAGATTIIVTDIDDGKLERATHFGATHVVNSAKQDPVEAVLEITGGGAPHVFDFVGAAPTLKQAAGMLEQGGTMYIIGIGGPEAKLEINALEFLVARKNLRTVYMGHSNLKRDIPMYAELYRQGRFKLDELITKTISLSQIDEGYEALKDGSIARVVVTDLER